MEASRRQNNKLGVESLCSQPRCSDTNHDIPPQWRSDLQKGQGFACNLILIECEIVSNRLYHIRISAEDIRSSLNCTV